MPQFVSHAVHGLVLYAVGRHPQATDEIVVGTTVGCAVERVHHHDHHLVAVGLRARQGELERVAEKGVERLHPSKHLGMNMNKMNTKPLPCFTTKKGIDKI